MVRCGPVLLSELLGCSRTGRGADGPRKSCKSDYGLGNHGAGAGAPSPWVGHSWRIVRAPTDLFADSAAACRTEEDEAAAMEARGLERRPGRRMMGLRSVLASVRVASLHCSFAGFQCGCPLVGRARQPLQEAYTLLGAMH